MKEIILALVISGLSSVLDQFARNENEKTDIGVNPDVRFLVKPIIVSVSILSIVFGVA